MSGTASSEIPRRDVLRAEKGAHVAYLFSSSAEKQSVLFQLCERVVTSDNSYLLYVAGKQGVKGIRLSLKDVRFDVAMYERKRQMQIVDSDEWYLLSAKQRLFKSFEELKAQFSSVASEASSAGFRYVTVISETDSLVRKGFYRNYADFDTRLGKAITELDVSFVCAFDQREMQVAGVGNPSEEISKTHSAII